jgi:hypothetical protein
MNKPKTIQINVPHPCHERWDAMTENSSGRHCNSCQKTVIDFSTWSDAQLFGFFSDGTKRNVCGRFQATQINKPIHIPYQPHSRLYRMTVALGLTLLFVQTPHLLAQTIPPPTSQSSRKEINSFITGGIEVPHGGCIYGSITNDKGEPIEALIHLYQNDTLIKSTQANQLGGFDLKDLGPGTYEILAVYGKDSLMTRRVIVNLRKPTKANIRFQWNPDPQLLYTLGGISATSPDDKKHALTKRHHKKGKK